MLVSLLACQPAERCPGCERRQNWAKLRKSPPRTSLGGTRHSKELAPRQDGFERLLGEQVSEVTRSASRIRGASWAGSVEEVGCAFDVELLEMAEAPFAHQPLGLCGSQTRAQAGPAVGQ